MATQIVVRGNLDVAAPIAAVGGIEPRAVVRLKPELVGRPEFPSGLVQTPGYQRVVARLV
jgi:hypothetical protein